MTLFEELQWRGLVHNTNGDLNHLFENEKVTFYVGTDPTMPTKPNTKDGRIKSSLHCGHLLAFAVARLLQSHGHKPIILVGRATCALGDPSGKAEERPLLDMEQIKVNSENIVKQITKIVSFDDTKENSAILVDNYDWFKDLTFLDFARGIGKYLTVNYLMAKDSVKSRLEREGQGLSLTEFLYGPTQAYDMLYLYEHYGCKMQIGGSDQWSNITNGNTLINKKLGRATETYALTWPLLLNSQGVKFGKSSDGKNCWLDEECTSPYEFYQFWMNQSDEDSKSLIKKFTLLPKEEIEALIEEHEKAPHKRILQSVLAKEVTVMVHSLEEYEKAVETSKILFGNASVEQLQNIDESALTSIDGIKEFTVEADEINNGISLISLMTEKTDIVSSKTECRKLVQGGGLSINKQKVSAIDKVVTNEDLLKGKYLLVQKGKKNYHLITVK